MNDSHIVRHDEPAIGYGGFTKEQHEAIKWRIIHHPAYDPEPKPSILSQALAWLISALGAVSS